MQQLLLGVARRVITPPIGGMLAGYAPPRPSVGVHDDVRVTVFAFSAAEQTALVISAEVCTFLVEIAQCVKAGLERETGVAAENMMLCCTHTHSSVHVAYDFDQPDGYVHTVFIPKVCEAAKEALAAMEPVQMGVGTAYSEVAINRRQIKPETGKAVLGQNPWGSWDPTMTVVSFRRPDGTAVANLIHYGCHNTACGKNDLISRDWAGVMVDALEERTGGVTAFINGCGGDCGPRLPNGKTVGDLEMAMELGQKAATDALRAYDNISDWQTPRMQVRCMPIRMPLRDIGTAEEVLAEAAAMGDPAELKGLNVGTYDQLMERAAYLQAGNIPPKAEIIDHTFLALGEVALQGIPFEPFSLITLRIKEGSPFRHTLCVGYTNGSRSYFPSMDQIPRGGYEVRMFLNRNLVPFADDAEQEYVTGSVACLHTLYNES